MNKTIISLAALALIAGCQSTPDEPLRATASLQPTKGSKTIGEVTFEQVSTAYKEQAAAMRNLFL